MVPLQTGLGLALAITDGRGLTFTRIESIVEQPLTSVPVTVYIVVVVVPNNCPFIIPLSQIYVLAPLPYKAAESLAQYEKPAEAVMCAIT